MSGFDSSENLTICLRKAGRKKSAKKSSGGGNSGNCVLLTNCPTSARLTSPPGSCRRLTTSTPNVPKTEPLASPSQPVSPSSLLAHGFAQARVILNAPTPHFQFTGKSYRLQHLQCSATSHHSLSLGSLPQTPS